MTTDADYRALAERLTGGKWGWKDTEAASSAILALLEERDKWRRLESEAAEHVESVICMRSSHFTGEPPYVGWEGLGRALRQDYDRATLAESRLGRAMEALREIAERQPMATAEMFRGFACNVLSDLENSDA